MMLLHGSPVTEHGRNLADGLLWGIAREHVPALIAAVLVPFVWWGVFAVASGSAECGRPWATRLVGGSAAASVPVRAVAFLLLVSGAMHLALAPSRVADDPVTAALFGLEAALFGWLAWRALTGGRWRVLAGLSLTASVLTYLGYLLSETERPDEVGVVNKLVELLALGLLLVPAWPGRRRWRRVRRVLAPSTFVFLTVLTGFITWAATLAAEEDARREPDGQHAMSGMLMQPAHWTEPTTAERAGADRLVDETRRGIARYADVGAAVAAGYRSSDPALGPAVHYEHPEYKEDGVTLDPDRPEMLVYAATEDYTLLLGAVYALDDVLATAPDAGGGALTSWHVHTNVCISPVGFAGLLSPFGTCPAFSVNIAGGPMMHVWIVAVPGGPFGLEPEQEDIDELLGVS